MRIGRHDIVHIIFTALATYVLYLCEAVTDIIPMVLTAFIAVSVMAIKLPIHSLFVTIIRITQKTE